MTITLWDTLLPPPLQIATKRLAVSTPGSKKLHKHRFPSGFLLAVCMRVVGFPCDPVVQRNQSHGLSRLMNSPLLHSFFHCYSPFRPVLFWWLTVSWWLGSPSSQVSFVSSMAATETTEAHHSTRCTNTMATKEIHTPRNCGKGLFFLTL